MKTSVHHTALLFVLLIAVSCTVVQNETQSENQIKDNSEWLIPSDEVVVGTGRAIPSIDDPKFKTAFDIDFIGDNELVLGLKINDQIRAYLHEVLNYHEVVDDQLASVPVSATFCPLTGSGIAGTEK